MHRFSFPYLFCLGITAASAQLKDPLEAGREAMRNTGWESAIRIWWQGAQDLKRQDRVDPRLGIAIIETITEKKASAYYGTASELYLWGFSEPCESQIETVCREAERVMPLLSREEQELWRKMIREKDPGLSRNIHRFWSDRDPRVSTEGNERLVEHWERIAHARNNFLKTTNSVYDCDDRGVIYVKYGKPDQRHNGYFRENMELTAMLAEMGTAAGAGGQSGRVQGTLLTNRQASIVTTDSDVSQSLAKLRDTNIEYEVWIYTGIEEKQSIPFLFSYEDGMGAFRLVNGVESVVPPPPRINPKTSREYEAQTILTFYSNLEAYHPIYEDRYQEMLSMMQTAKFGKGDWTRTVQVLSGRYEGEDKLNPVTRYAVSDKSDYQQRTGSIAMEINPMRFLDKEGEPLLAAYVATSPSFKFYDTDGSSIPDHEIVHTLALRDPKDRKLFSQQYTSMGSMDHVTLFSMPHIHKSSVLTVGAEAIPFDTQGDTMKLLAMGTSNVSLPDPLSTDKSEMELSDVVLGVRSGIQTPEGFALPLTPARKFVSGDTLQYYLEIYNLLLDETGRSRGQIQYGIHEIRTRGNEETRKQRVSLAYEFSTESRRANETLSVALGKLKPGEYAFIVKVTDRLGSGSKTREARFTVGK